MLAWAVLRSEFCRGFGSTDEWEKLGPWTRGVRESVQTGVLMVADMRIKPKGIGPEKSPSYPSNTSLPLVPLFTKLPSYNVFYQLRRWFFPNHHPPTRRSWASSALWAEGDPRAFETGSRFERGPILFGVLRKFLYMIRKLLWLMERVPRRPVTTTRPNLRARRSSREPRTWRQ